YWPRIIMPITNQHRLPISIDAVRHTESHLRVRVPLLVLSRNRNLSTLSLYTSNLVAVVGLTRVSGRRLVVVASATDSASHTAQDRQHHTDDEQDDSDGPEDRDLEQESGDEQDDSKDDHGCEPFYPPDCQLETGPVERPPDAGLGQVPLTQGAY